MPPFIPFKRPNSDTPEPESPPAKRAATKSAKAKATAKPTPTSHNPVIARSSQRASQHRPSTGTGRALLKHDEDESSLSDISNSDDESDEHSPIQKKAHSHSAHSVAPSKAPRESSDSGTDEESSDDGDHWDDYLAAQATDDNIHTNALGDAEEQEKEQDAASGEHLELTLDEAATIDYAAIAKERNGKKKGPTKIEREIRVGAHQMHVQMLIHHNWIRNKWCDDTAVQNHIRNAFTPVIKHEVKRWKEACGKKIGDEGLHGADGEDGSSKASGQGASSSKRKSKEKHQRNWGPKAEHLEAGNPNLSAGDPTIRLLKVLSAFWRKRFNITSPGFRKLGYKDMRRLKVETEGFRDDEHDPKLHGERVENIDEFRKLAMMAEGSRDVGAQLFTALLRCVGLQARLVANLQPLGFGWSKVEEADPAKPVKAKSSSNQAKSKTPKAPAKARASRVAEPTGKEDQPISLSDSDSELSPPPTDLDALNEPESDEADDASVIEVTPSRPAGGRKRFDRDLPFPIYWTEALSPITNTWIPVDPVVGGVVVNSPEANQVFEPRGSKADKAKQVMAYVIAYASDNTAKDVTVRYLKRHVWPGKTKGFRMPIEKIAITNKRGKILRTEEYDWFKAVMSCYTDPKKKRSEADKIEDERDLKAIRITREKGSNSNDPDSLQAYKSSAEYVLERHLRREEALKVSAKPVRNFVVGKGDNAKAEPVYLREDVVNCKTVESWHKEGREITAGQQPLKWVPMRAVTAVRKREMEEVERQTGEKPQQGLYSREQTDWIIPPPIEDGIIPKNAFGNIDVYVPTMIPKGAVHVPLRGTVRVCKKLGIDFAEACTGFEFGNKMAVPILTGVVVAAENKRLVMDAWRVEEKIKKEKEDKKREQLALGVWRAFFNGLRVIDRVRKEYGNSGVMDRSVQQEVQAALKKSGQKGPAKKKAGTSKKEAIQIDDDDAMSNTFIDPSFKDDPEPGGFIIDDKPDNDVSGGGFIIEGENEAFDTPPNKHTIKATGEPISLQSLHAQTEGTSRMDEDATMNGNDTPQPKDKPDHLNFDDDITEEPPEPSKRATKSKPKTPAKPKVGRPKKSTNTSSTPSTKTRPSRQSAKKSTEAIKSHYFEDDESADTSLAPEHTPRRAARRSGRPRNTPAQSVNLIDSDSE